MATVRPFRALRYAESAGTPAELCCPPYDIVSEEERLAFLARNPNNIIRLELPREGADPYAVAAEELARMTKEGVLRREETDCLYLYREAFTVKGRAYAFTGIVARVGLVPFSEGVVLPHEWTLSKAKQDRFALMDATRCNFSSIYSLYEDESGATAGRIARLTAAAPDQSFTDGEGVTHSLWIVRDPAETAALCADFADRKLYIADGHHRYETALAFRDHLRETGQAVPGDAADYCLMTLVALDDPGLVVFPTHRVVRGLEGFDAAALATSCADAFDVAPLADDTDDDALLAAAAQKGETAFVFYAGRGKAWLLTLRDTSGVDAACPDASAAYKELDVTRLHSLILEKRLGIDKANMAAQINLTYTRSAEEAKALVDRGEANACFLINPTRVAQIRAVAAAGDKMPQKSTYFYPKLITGLVMNRLDDKE